MKVIHVHLIFEKKDYYFGSIEAIFTILSEDQLAIKKSYLKALRLSDGAVKLTSRAIIRASRLITSGSRTD